MIPVLVSEPVRVEKSHPHRDVQNEGLVRTGFIRSLQCVVWCVVCYDVVCGVLYVMMLCVVLCVVCYDVVCYVVCCMLCGVLCVMMLCVMCYVLCGVCCML